MDVHLLFQILLSWRHCYFSLQSFIILNCFFITAFYFLWFQTVLVGLWLRIVLSHDALLFLQLFQVAVLNLEAPALDNGAVRLEFVLHLLKPETLSHFFILYFGSFLRRVVLNKGLYISNNFEWLVDEIYKLPLLLVNINL